MQLSKKQNEYIVNAIHRWNFKSGAVRSGKSYVDTAFVIPFRIRERAGKPGLNVILGVSKSSIERNVLAPMREIYTDKLIGTINSQNIAMVCGEPVYCLGAEKVSQVAKIQGASIKYCYGDEVAKWNKEVFQMLKSRLDKPYSCFDGSCNPEHPTHWLKEFLDNVELDIYLQKYTIFDNPFLPKEFVEQLCKEYEGTIYYDRLIVGLWKRADGAIYKRFADKMKKEELIALGVSEEQAEKIVSSWNETLKGYILKAEFDTKVQELETTKQQLDTANQTIEGFKDYEDVKAQVNEYKTKFEQSEQEKADIQANYEFTGKLQEAAKKAGARALKAVMPYLDVESLKKSQNQDADIAATFETVKKENAFLFGVDEPINHPTGPTGGENGNQQTTAIRAAMGLPEEK